MEERLMKGNSMITVKKNKVFESRDTFNRIRVRDVRSDKFDPRYNLVTVVNINDNGKAIKGTERTIYQDSIRRRYFAG